MLSHVLELYPSVLPALCGGVGVGLASSGNLLLCGRITGFSGIVATTMQQLTRPANKTATAGMKQTAQMRSAWQPMFLSAFLGTGAALQSLAPQLLHLGHGWSTLASGPTSAAVTLAVLSGGLVGYGSRLGSGCTSGHGVCGLPRLSRRSFVTVGTWFATAPFAAMAAARLYGSSVGAALVPLPSLSSVALPGVLITSAGLAMLAVRIHRQNTQLAAASSLTPPDSFSSLLASAAVASLFSSSLLVSGMVDPDYVQGFLDPICRAFNPAMGGVFAGALGVNFPAFWYILSRKRPVLLSSFSLPTKTAVDRDLLTGAVLFGAGWGLGGICPGPGLLSLLTGNPLSAIWLASMIAAMHMHARGSSQQK